MKSCKGRKVSELRLRVSDVCARCGENEWLGPGRKCVGGREKLFLLHLFYLRSHKTINRNVLWSISGERWRASKSLMPGNLFSEKCFSLFKFRGDAQKEELPSDEHISF